MAKQIGVGFWTNPSVLALSHGRDPLEAITTDARNLVFRALESGWHGPPFDPFVLAELLGIETVPTAEVLDARTVPFAGNRYRIEFNPDRPRRRIRYSVFHEIAHTIFPDCGHVIRNRGVHTGGRSDDWQLEMLCNIAAAEFLLPTGALGESRNLRPSIDLVLELRWKYEASGEAALLRISRLTTEPSLAFSCHRDRMSGRYVVEYGMPTGSSPLTLRPGSVLPLRTAAAECTAIGYTAKQTETWPRFGEVRIECVGVSPLPREIYPRVVGFVRQVGARPSGEVPITYIRGDATYTRGTDHRLLVHIVNDGAFTWGGGGIAASIKRKWPSAQKSFTAEVTSDRTKLRLGNVLTSDLEPGLTLISAIAQHGYGESRRARIRYGALRDCLFRILDIANKLKASVHMPRIGTGQAGGSWPVVEEIIHETLTKTGIKVVVYDLPQGRERPKAQGDLAFVR